MAIHSAKCPCKKGELCFGEPMLCADDQGSGISVPWECTVCGSSGIDWYDATVRVQTHDGVLDEDISVSYDVDGNRIMEEAA